MKKTKYILLLMILILGVSCQYFSSPPACNYEENKFCVEATDIGNALEADMKKWCEDGGGKFTNEGCPEEKIKANCDNITDEDFTKMQIDDQGVGTLKEIAYRFYALTVISPYSEAEDEEDTEDICKEAGGKYSKTE